MKKKSHKRMQMGGMAGMADRMGRGSKRPSMGGMKGGAGDSALMSALGGGRGGPGFTPGPSRGRGKPMSSDEIKYTMPIEGGMKKAMRGGGLARKGVGMALAKGGMVRGSGCAKRGVKKAKSY